MNKRKNKLNFVLKVIRNGKEIERYESHSKRSFYNKIRMINWEKPYPSVYLRVSYGKLLASSGKYENFWNDGVYNNGADLLLAFNAFTEK